MTKKQKVIIVGAGIVGASIAYNLSKENQDVTLVESHSKAGCGVTANSFAWINPSGRTLCRKNNSPASIGLRTSFKRISKGSAICF